MEMAGDGSEGVRMGYNSEVCCDVGHRGLVVELAQPGDSAIYQWDCFGPLQQCSVLSWY